MTSIPETVPEWGLKPVGPFSVAWGARTLYKGPVSPARSHKAKGGRREAKGAPLGPQFDILGDRQGFAGGSKVDQRAFMTWLNTVGLLELHKRVFEANLWPDSEQVLAFELDGIEFRASCRRSCGYLYVGAWKPEAFK